MCLISVMFPAKPLADDQKLSENFPQHSLTPMSYLVDNNSSSFLVTFWQMAVLG